MNNLSKLEKKSRRYIFSRLMFYKIDPSFNYTFSYKTKTTDHERITFCKSVEWAWSADAKSKSAEKRAIFNPGNLVSNYKAFLFRGFGPSFWSEKGNQGCCLRTGYVRFSFEGCHDNRGPSNFEKKIQKKAFWTFTPKKDGTCFSISKRAIQKTQISSFCDVIFWK